MTTLPSMKSPLPLIWGYTQLMTDEKIESLRGLAEYQYPDELPDDALLKYVKGKKVQGIIFPGDQGQRCTWGRDIRFFRDKTARGFRHLLEESDDRGRKYLVSDTKPTLSGIDERRNQWALDLLKHASEDHPIPSLDHSAHFSKLSDVLSLILDYVLTPSKRGERLHPLVISCNWKANWCVPHYMPISQHITDIDQTLQIAQCDQHGSSYIELRDFYRAAIDATILRVSKQFKKLGAKTLYGQNAFSFDMTHTTYPSCPPSLFGPAAHRTVYRPYPGKPACDELWIEKITAAIKQIENRVPRTKLSGLVYYDNFLRFLYLLGPHNCALLSDLEFTGIVKLHECDSDECVSGCADDFVHSLELYGHFMAYFCKGLRKLTLNVDRDSKGPQPFVNGEGLRVDPSGEAILPFLRERLPFVEGLRTLIVRVDRVSTYAGEVINGEPASWAGEVVEWFEQRGRDRDQQKERKIHEC